jgi:hypothetical protein
MWGIVVQKGEREGGKKERKGEKSGKEWNVLLYFDASSSFLRNTQNIGISEYI